MAGKYLDRLPHSCGTRQGLQVFAREDGGVDGYCFACGTPVRHPYGEPRDAKDLPKPKEPTPEELEALLKEPLTYPIVDLPKRKLRAGTLKYFNVHIALNESDGVTPDEVYYPFTRKGEITGFKVRLCSEKKMWSIGSMKDVDFFGWEQAKSSGAKKLIITEGEDDAIALKRLLDLKTPTQYQHLKPAVVSLVHGAQSAKRDCARMSGEIRKYFREVVLAFDMDQPGQKAVEDAMLVLPEATVASLPCKDPRDCIIEGKGDELYAAITFNSKKPKNTRILDIETIHEQYSDPPKWGELSWPWRHINNATRGIRYGETIYIGAGVKMGKSELVNQLAVHFALVHNVMSFLAKPEESLGKSGKLLAGKAVGKIFHDPKVEYNKKEYERACELLRGKIKILDLYQHVGWETLRADIIDAASQGCKAIFIDPITNLTDDLSASEANTQLQSISKDLSALALDHDIVIFIFCHLKSHEGQISNDVRKQAYQKGRTIGLGNCSHELGGDVYSNQFAGSRAMMRKCNYMISLEGNKDTELPEDVRRIRHLHILEDREFGEVGRYPLIWSPVTQLYTEY